MMGVKKRGPAPKPPAAAEKPKEEVYMYSIHIQLYTCTAPYAIQVTYT